MTSAFTLRINDRLVREPRPTWGPTQQRDHDAITLFYRAFQKRVERGDVPVHAAFLASDYYGLSRSARMDVANALDANLAFQEREKKGFVPMPTKEFFRSGLSVEACLPIIKAARQRHENSVQGMYLAA